jgi:hypothetical protein
MAENHSSNLISRVQLPGTDGSTVVYDIHDVEAVHTLADLAALGMDTSGVFVYKGTVATVDKLPKTGAKVGEVYHVTSTGSEYVWAEGKWEEFGEHFVVNHTHNMTVTGENSASSVTGSATVGGQNQASSISGTATIDIPDVSVSPKYAKISTDSSSFVKSYTGATSKMETVSITSVGAATSVISSVTATPGTITGVSGSTTASKAVAGTAFDVAKVGTSTKVATGLTGGSVASWSASVDNGTLSFNFTPNSLQTASTTNITPAAAAGTITPYTFTNVTVPKADASATSVITGVSTTPANNIATVGTENCEVFEKKLEAAGYHYTERVQVGATIGTHVGPGVFGMIFVQK